MKTHLKPEHHGVFWGVGARRALMTAAALVSIGAALASGAPASAAGGIRSTVDEAVDGSGHCHNGNPPVNCNQYDGKQYVWAYSGNMNAGKNSTLSYFFAILVPGGQHDPNDGAADNLSSPYDSYTNRTFTTDVSGVTSSYSGSHAFDSGAQLINMMPYADTTDPGGVYILAICSLANGYPVAASDCSYDAFKVETPTYASLAVSTRFSAVRHGPQLELRWTVPSTQGIAGFAVFAGSQRLNSKLIAPSAARSYSFSTRWSGSSSYRLQVLMRNGELLTIHPR